MYPVASDTLNLRAEMTPELLLKCMPFAGQRTAVFAVSLTEAMEEFEIHSSIRQAAFLAQIAHESSSLNYTEEIADGSAYEARLDLGNTERGDGKRYKGRGLIQITGRANYTSCGQALHLDLIGSPELLQGTEAACRSAGWFWKTRGLNELADKDAFGTISRKINGGFNGIDDRIKHWLRARSALGL